MDPIRPIGPRERDLEPVVWVARPAPDGQRERREQPDTPSRREPQPASPDVARPGDPDEPESLIDIRV
jgi:hypothetical protein